MVDVFYSPTYKDVVKRKRNKRKFDVVVVTILENEPMDIVWKDLHMDPWENLTKLSQLAAAYATETIEKAT